MKKMEFVKVVLNIMIKPIINSQRVSETCSAKQIRCTSKDIGEPKKPETSARAVAEYLMSLDPERKFFTKRKGNFRLNTLLHISQILYCAKYGKPLFKEVLYAYPPKWNLLNQTRQKELSRIIHDKNIKNKRFLIHKLYGEQNIKLTPYEKKLILGDAKLK